MQIEKLKPIPCPVCTEQFALEQKVAVSAIHSKPLLKLRKSQTNPTRRAPQVGKAKTLADLLIAASIEDSDAYTAVKRYDPGRYDWEIEAGVERLLLIGILAFAGCGGLYLLYYFEVDFQLIGLGIVLAFFLYGLISDKIRDTRFEQWRRQLLAGRIRPQTDWICLACLHTWRAPAPMKRRSKSSRLF